MDDYLKNLQTDKVKDKDLTRPDQTNVCISIKLQNVFVPNSKIYLSQIAKCICLKSANFICLRLL